MENHILKLKLNKNSKLMPQKKFPQWF